MRGRKGKLGLLLCVAAAMIASFPAAASEALEVHLENSRSADGELLLYVNNNLEAEKKAAAEHYKISLGGEEIPIKGIERFGDTKEGASWIFLADVSGSIPRAQMEEMKDYLKLIVQQLPEQDQVSIAALGNNLTIGPFLSDKEEILESIDGIQVIGEDTNLYYGITEALKVLDAGSTGDYRRGLVVVSDGEDDQAAGITREEVNRQIEISRIPIFTTAVLESGADESSIEFAKVLGSFARLSPGGIHTALGIDDLSPEESVGQVAAFMADSLIIHGDLSGYTPSSGENYLQISLTDEGRGEASDGYSLPAGDISVPETEPAPEESAPEEESSAAPPPEEPAPAEESGPPMEVLAIAGGAAVILAAICAVIFIKRKKKKAAEEKQEIEIPLPEEPEPLPESATGEISEEEAEEPEDSGETFEEEKKEEEIPEQRAEEPAGREVYLTRIGMAEEVTYRITIKGQISIGRSPQKADCVFPEDPQLSGLHCILADCDGDLVLCDQNSTNGTQVNGIPISQPYVLKCDDVIRMGSSDYRIHWTEGEGPTADE